MAKSKANSSKSGAERFEATSKGIIVHKQGGNKGKASTGSKAKGGK